MHKLNIWQESGYREDLIDRIKSAYGMEPLSSILGGPSFISFSKHDGYSRVFWKNHPLADSHRVVLEHQLIVWQESGYDEKLLDLFLTRQATVHHKNGVRDNNGLENLEIRMKGNHPTGIGEQDMVGVLRSRGYIVVLP